MEEREEWNTSHESRSGDRLRKEENQQGEEGSKQWKKER